MAEPASSSWFTLENIAAGVGGRWWCRIAGAVRPGRVLAKKAKHLLKSLAQNTLASPSTEVNGIWVRGIEPDTPNCIVWARFHEKPVAGTQEVL